VSVEDIGPAKFQIDVVVCDKSPAMTFDDSTLASTAQICQLAHFSRQRLNALQAEGIVQPVGRGEWPLVATLNALFEHLRTQRDTVSDTRREWEKVKVERERLRVARESHEVINRSEFDDAWKICWGILTSRLANVAPRITRDLALRATIGRALGELRNEVSNEFEKQAAALETSGEAAPVR
jgi:hypothetical protein